MGFFDAISDPLHLILNDIYANDYRIKKDHLYSVMSTRAVHIEFLRNYAPKVVTAIDHFKEPGRIIATSILNEPIAGFKFIETGQPYANNPETEKIAHIAVCIVDKNGEYLDAEAQNSAMAKLLAFWGLTMDSPGSIESFTHKGYQFRGIKKDMFGGNLTAIKLDLIFNQRSYQIEIRVNPIENTLGQVEKSVMDAVHQ